MRVHRKSARLRSSSLLSPGVSIHFQDIHFSAKKSDFSQKDFALTLKLWPANFFQHRLNFAGNSHSSGISWLFTNFNGHLQSAQKTSSTWCALNVDATDLPHGNPKSCPSFSQRRRQFFRCFFGLNPFPLPYVRLSPLHTFLQHLKLCQQV